MGKVICYTNQKGGVGKTTASVMTAHAASELLLNEGSDEQILFVDLCGQGNSSHDLTGDLLIHKTAGGAELLFGELTDLVYKETLLPNVKLLHGHRYLEGLDKDPWYLQRASEMRSFIKDLPFKYVIIDTPPALGIRIAAPLMWSDLVVLMVEPKLSSLTGLDDTFDTIKGARRKNPGLVVRMVVNRYTKSSKTQTLFREQLYQKFGKSIMAEFALRTPVTDAIQNGLPVWRFSKDKALGKSWRDFTIEALK